jgi:hypothetical protein
MSGGDNGGGSHPWPWAFHMKGDDYTPWPMSKSGAPTAIEDLIGRKVRVVRRDGKEPQGYEPGRVSFLVNDEGRILNVFFERDLPIK